MSSIASFITAFCVCSVGISALFMLCPKGSIAKSVRYVFCLAFLCCLIPCITLFKGFTVKTDTSGIYNTDTTCDLVNTVIKETFESTLKNADIEFTKIEVYTDKTDSDSITISEVKIYSSCNPQDIKDLFGKTENIKVTVINE